MSTPTLTPELKFKNKSAASKRNWAKVDAEERHKRMSKIAKIKQSKLSVTEKKAQALAMVRGREK